MTNQSRIINIFEKVSNLKRYNELLDDVDIKIKVGKNGVSKSLTIIDSRGKSKYKYFILGFRNELNNFHIEEVGKFDLQQKEDPIVWMGYELEHNAEVDSLLNEIEGLVDLISRC